MFLWGLLMKLSLMSFTTYGWITKIPYFIVVGWYLSLKMLMKHLLQFLSRFETSIQNLAIPRECVYSCWCKHVDSDGVALDFLSVGMCQMTSQNMVHQIINSIRKYNRCMTTGKYHAMYWFGKQFGFICQPRKRAIRAGVLFVETHDTVKSSPKISLS
jgi:hypothetical protein